MSYRRGVKVLSLIGSALLAGCGGLTPMEHLERQALLTGDWSAVEKRERMLRRRDAHAGVRCPHGQVRVCQNDVGAERCDCWERDMLFRILGGY
ncbi:MAG: hypothetical protein OEO82_00475 [Gammaproteobacteria bacterium]|nr:hypothetical protein [Gammaproteobacteria bacterium]